MSDITDLSKEYLKKFLFYAKKELGYEPIILGGWAVYSLTQVEQSIDVDVLLKSKNDIQKLKKFFDEHKFVEDKDNQENISFELVLESLEEVRGITINSLIFDLIT